MSFYYAYTCDVCQQVSQTWPHDGYCFSARRPEGWRQVDGRDLCSLDCLARYAQDAEAFPRQQMDPNPLVKALTNGLKVAPQP